MRKINNTNMLQANCAIAGIRVCLGVCNFKKNYGDRELIVQKSKYLQIVLTVRVIKCEMTFINDHQLPCGFQRIYFNLLFIHLKSIKVFLEFILIKNE